VREKLVIASEAQILCPSAFAQATVSTYFGTMPWQQQLKTFREIYRERRDVALEALDDLMPDGTRWTVPSGGFYIWLTLPDGLHSKEMLPRAIAERVAYVPGTGFLRRWNRWGTPSPVLLVPRRLSGSVRGVRRPRRSHRAGVSVAVRFSASPRALRHPMR